MTTTETAVEQLAPGVWRWRVQSATGLSLGVVATEEAAHACVVAFARPPIGLETPQHGYALPYYTPERSQRRGRG